MQRWHSGPFTGSVFMRGWDFDPLGMCRTLKQRSAVSSGPGKGYGEGMHFLVITATVVVHRRGEPVRVEEDYFSDRWWRTPR